MSFNSAMLAGVSGLKANSSALAAIGQDISNVNTIGYKQTQVAFETLVNGGTGENSSYSAGGVLTANQQLVAQQGSMTETNSATDLAITGQGLFVTNTQAAVPGVANGQVLFTRAGSFTPDAQGYLKNTANLYLMGWPADAQGNINTSGTNISSLGPINVNSVAGTVAPTTQADIDANLNASQPVSAAAAAFGGPGGYDPATNSMTANSTNPATGVQPDFTIQIPISDSLGGQLNLQLDLLKSSTPNQWYAEIQAVPASDVVSGAGLAPGQIAAGIIAFNPDGTINTGATTLPGAVSLGASAAGAPGAGAANWAASLGVAAQSINLNIGGASGLGNLTQLATASAVGQVTTDGTPFSKLSAISINDAGIVSATFANGTTRNIAQVALATFPNVDGLTAVSGNAYMASTASGGYALKTAGAGGAGTLTSSALESSTVDLSAEFANLIISQNAYSASSKVITTANEMMQALMNVMR
ncbi:MAG: flagellar hook protein FlgE [Caulobacteraceae bacterium]|nr:flagellar hook protein FlgE [Caulobacteraceae bacterium]